MSQDAQGAAGPECSQKTQGVPGGHQEKDHLIREVTWKKKTKTKQDK